MLVDSRVSVTHKTKQNSDETGVDCGPISIEAGGPCPTCCGGACPAAPLRITGQVTPPVLTPIDLCFACASTALTSVCDKQYDRCLHQLAPHNCSACLGALLWGLAPPGPSPNLPLCFSDPLACNMLQCAVGTCITYCGPVFAGIGAPTQCPPEPICPPYGARCDPAISNACCSPNQCLRHAFTCGGANASDYRCAIPGGVNFPVA